MKSRSFGFLVGGVVVLALVAAFVFFPRRAAPMEQVLASQPSPEAPPMREVRPHVSPVLIVDGGSAAARFEGEVQEPDGTPIEAEIDFSDGTDTETVRSGADGHFSFTARPGSWEVAALRADGFIGHAPSLELVAVAGVVFDGIELTMSRARELNVLVLVEGRPLAGARVTLEDDGLDSISFERTQETTNTAGRATLKFLASSEKVIVSVGHECCLFATRSVGVEDREIVVELTRFENAETRRIVGRVVDESDEPLADAGVTLLASGHDGGLRSRQIETRSDARGGFVADVPGDEVRISAAYGSNQSESLDFLVTDTPVIVVWRADASLSGRVTDSAGRPVTHFEIGVWGGPYRIRTQDVRSGDGRYKLTKLVRGAVKVEASSDDFAPAERRRVTLKAGEVPDVDFVLAEGLRMTGLVRAANTARPIEGALVTVDGRSAETDSTGHFALHTRTSDSLAISVSKSGFVTRETHAAAGSSVVIELREPTDGGPYQREFEGIGAQLELSSTLDGGNRFTIETLHAEGSAKAAGLEVGDEVLQVESALTRAMPSEDVISLIRGPEGSVVRLTIRRGDRVFDANVVRRKLVW